MRRASRRASRRRAGARALLLAAALAAGASGAAAGPARAEEAFEFPRGRGVVETASGGRHAFDLEIAETPRARARGLMFRERLEPGAGMLLLWPEPREVSIWMANTLVPLDLFYVRADGSIALVRERARPLDRTPLPGGEPVAAVLEAAGGTAERLGIRAGDRFRLLP